MFHLPNTEIFGILADLCLINLTSNSKNRAVIVTKVRSHRNMESQVQSLESTCLRGHVKRQGHNRTVASEGNQSLKMEKIMSHVHPSVEPHSSPHTFMQFSKLLSAYSAQGPGSVLPFPLTKRHANP